MSRKYSKNDVAWYSTISASETIKLYSELLTEPCTSNNLLRYFDEHKLVGLYEEKEVLMKYVELGCGDDVLTLYG